MPVLGLEAALWGDALHEGLNSSLGLQKETAAFGFWHIKFQR